MKMNILSSISQKVLRKSNIIIKCTSLPLLSRNRSHNVVTSRTLALSSISSASNDMKTDPLELTEKITAVLSTEPSFSSQGLGLANGYPSGVIQAIMEQIHLCTDLPWWGTIITCTYVRVRMYIKLVTYGVDVDILLLTLSARVHINNKISKIGH